MNLLLFLLPMILVLYAQGRISETYTKYRKIRCIKGFTGEMVARIILERNNLSDVDVCVSQGGQLSDFYDPNLKRVHLSNDVYYGNSIASIAVAAHEVGHAIQHAHQYSFLVLRNRLLPYMQLSSQMGWIILLIGFISNSTSFVFLSLVLLCIAVVFQVITLPIELDASKRAKIELTHYTIVSDTQELDAVDHMLKAAAFTYFASLVSSIAFILRIFLMTNNRNN